MTSPTGDRRGRVLDLLGRALEVAPESRGTWLSEECGDDQDLRREVQDLLDLEPQTDGFLDSPFVDPPSARGKDPEIGRRIGPYRIVGLLGRGGMGGVYRAAREDDYEQQAAIKLLHRGLAQPDLLQRFHAERQILARFDHPSIARLLDGGTTEGGRPYLVMELIDGLPIHRFCTEHDLSIGARLELFLQVLDAVAYAHRNLVVHRDLKPGNILVTPTGAPKLLDFGIAKMLGPDAGRTTTGPSAMTPFYASPEQILGDPITTASDVYALGVLLYKLLTDLLPCDLAHCSLPEIAQRICEHEPQPPSRVASTPKLRRRLAGDVDTIVLKALHKDPRERYASVEQLADDVRHHLKGLPILARRDAWAYRAGKLALRYRWAVAAALLIVAASIVSTWQWRNAEIERRRAVEQRDRSDRVLRILQDLIGAAEPDASGGRDPTVRQILGGGHEQIDEILEEDPELAATFATELAETYRELGLHEEQLALARQAVGLRRALHPRGNVELAAAVNELASAHYYLKHYDEAERFFREALTMRRSLKESPSRIAMESSNLASVLKHQGRWDEAAEFYGEALAIREADPTAEPPEIASSLYALGTLDFERGLPESAEKRLRRALKIRIEHLGAHHTRVATIENSLGRVLRVLGRLDEAEAFQRRALATREDLYDENHIAPAVTQRDLAEVLLDRGRLDECARRLEIAMHGLRRIRSPDDWTIAIAQSVHGGYLAATGHAEQARPVLATSCETLIATKGERSIYTREACRRLEELADEAR